MIRLMGSVLMEIHEKWVSGKKYFTTERYQADKEEAKNAIQVIHEPLNHSGPYRKLNLHQHYGLDSTNIVFGQGSMNTNRWEV